MKRNEINLMITSSIFISILLGIFYLWLNEDVLSFKTGFKSISFGLTAVTLFWGFYFNYGWKWPIIKKMFYRPNINGTWVGELESDWKDKNGNQIPNKKIFVVIRQNFLRVNFSTFTDNFIGKSYSETFALNKTRGIKNVAYLYRKETSVKGDNLNNEGATELRLIESRPNRLEGKYWSNIKTNGTLKFTFLSKKTVDSYEDGLNLEQK